MNRAIGGLLVLIALATPGCRWFCEEEWNRRYAAPMYAAPVYCPPGCQPTCAPATVAQPNCSPAVGTVPAR